MDVAAARLHHAPCQGHAQGLHTRTIGSEKHRQRAYLNTDVVDVVGLVEDHDAAVLDLFAHHRRDLRI